MLVEIILYVKDQNKSKYFYEQFLGFTPILDVPGMTAFQLNEKTRLGLMPEEGIAKIITPQMQHPSIANGVPRCELYLHVDSLTQSFQKLENLGAKLISPISKRSWGVDVAYFSDLDGNIIAIWN